MTSNQTAVNEALWSRRELVSEYTRTDLRPPETMFLLRHRDGLSGSVLELGCGGGRVTLYLAEVADRVHGVDYSPDMLEVARRLVPSATFAQLDILDMSSIADASFGAVVAPFNVLDVVGVEDRRRAIDSVHRILEPGGLFVFSSHNLGAEALIEEPLQIRGHGVLRGARRLVRSVKWRRNRRRLLPMEERAEDYAILNDLGHDFQALHYYVFRDDQERQLRRQGFELLECLGFTDGRPVPPGSKAPESTELHYVARKLES